MKINDIFKCEGNLLFGRDEMKNTSFIKYLIIFLFTLNLNATNYFLGKEKYDIMSKYRAEAFASKRIYFGVEGSSEYYTDHDFLYLQEYYSSPGTGLNMGLYLVTKTNGSSGSSAPKFIIAFGGTLATNIKDGSITSKLDILNDFLTDLNFLNNRKLSIIQAKEALDTANKFIKKYDIKKDNIILAGHSLGGALVQYVSKNTDIKGVTFNTAPYPVYGNIAFNGKELLNLDLDVVNIMSDMDPLTGTLTFIEDLEQERSTSTSHAGELITKIPYQLPMLSSIISDLAKDYIHVNIDFTKAKNKEKLIKTLSAALAKFSQQTFNDTVKDTLRNRFIKILGFPTFSDGEYSLAKSNYYLALSYLMAKDYRNFILYIKKSFNLDTEIKLKKIFYGERFVLKTNTGHGMLELIQASYIDFYKTDTRVNDIAGHIGEKKIRYFVGKKYIEASPKGKFHPNGLLTPTDFMETITKASYGEVYSSKECAYSVYLKEDKKIDINFISIKKGTTYSSVIKNNISYPCKNSEAITETTTEVGFDENGKPYPVYTTRLIGLKAINISRLYTAKVISNIIIRETSKDNIKQFDKCNIPSGATITECTFFLKSKCIIPNISNYDFRPYANITRGEFVVMAYKMQEVLSGKNLCRHNKVQQ